MAIKDIWPFAFPSDVGGQNWNPGLSMRDYFAAKAMQGILVRYGSNANSALAVEAYCIADAMLEERGK